MTSELLRKEGVKALWKGNVPAEFLYVLYGASQFSSYTAINRALTTVENDVIGVPLAAQLHLLLAGCGSGLVSTLATYPLDLLRTRLAAHNQRLFKSMSATFREIYSELGSKGLFLGIRPSLLSSVATSGLFFSFYSLARQTSATFKTAYWGEEAVCGFLAGAAAKTCTFPLDTLRKWLQMAPHRAAFSLAVESWKLRGMKGFYRGFGVSLFKSAPTSALLVAVYEYALHWTQVTFQ